MLLFNIIFLLLAAGFNQINCMDYTTLKTKSNTDTTVNNEIEPKITRYHIAINNSGETREIRVFENSVLRIQKFHDPNITIAPNQFCITCNDLLEEYEIPFPAIFCDNKKYQNTMSASIEHGDPLIISFDPNYTIKSPYPNLRYLLGHELAHKYLTTPALMEQRNYYNTISNSMPYVYAALTATSCSSLLMPAPWDTIIAGTSGAAYLSWMYYVHSITKPLRKNELECDAMAIQIFGRNTQEQIEVCKEGIDRLTRRYTAQSFSQRFNSKESDIINSHPGDHTRINALQKIKVGLEQELARKSE